MRTIAKFLLFIAVVWLLPSCATRKRKEDLSALGKLYHNTTAKFNGYYNATVLYDESMLQLNQQQEDNYNKVLDVYPYMNAPNPAAVAPKLDKAIEKVSVVIALHRVSHWTDDCYLLMGQSQFLKKDYESAEETLLYMLEEYPPDYKAGTIKPSTSQGKKKKKLSKRERKKLEKKKRKDRERKRKERKKEIERLRKLRKKRAKRRSKNREEGIKNPTELKEIKLKDEAVEKEEESQAEENAVAKEGDPPGYFLKHKPAYQEGKLWYARTLVERGKLTMANRIFRELANDPNTFSEIREALAPALAHAAIKGDRLEEAVVFLDEAIALSGQRSLKARYAYIKAQLQQKLNDSNGAYASFQQALRYSTDYEMEFSARLQMAQNAWATGQSSPAEITETLNDMLKDIKNIDYKDRIYFTLAQIALQNDNKALAIENLQLSLNNNTGNNTQKAESYYQLASLYYDDENFVKAKLYFDSTLNVMVQTDERYGKVRKYSNNLTEIASSLQVINYQDSLLHISAMSDAEKEELALLLKKREEEARIKAALAAATTPTQGTPGRPHAVKTSLPSALNSSFNRINRNNRGSNAVIGDFFAYDDRAVRRGKKAFQNKWQNRPLVDNWRISSLIDENIEIAEIQDEQQTVVKGTISEEEIKQILADVPSNPVEIAASKKAIENALFKLGKLYREKLENPEKSVESLESLLGRFPKTEYKLDAYYYLYLSYTDLNNTAKANEYRKKILDEFDDSVYAKVLNNPNYFEETMDQERKLNAYYDQTFEAFNQGNYQVAYQRSVQADTEFGVDNPLRARFALLGAMAAGNLEGKKAYVAGLKNVVANFPETPEARRAKEILRLLGDESSFSKIDDGEDNEANAATAKNPFTVDFDQQHYVVVLLKENADLNKAKSDIGNFHLKYHKLENLRMSNIYLGDANSKTPLIVIRRFKNKDDVMRYYSGATKNAKDFLSAGFEYKILPISQNNYREILKARSVDGYETFFKENYLK